MVSTEKKTRSELKREAIIKAAREAFRKHGVQGASMDLIAEQAQVSKRTVYNHFATKEELVTHLISDLWRVAMHDLAQEYERDESLQLQLQALLSAEIELVSSREYIELSRMAFAHYIYRPEAMLEELQALQADETVLQRWLKQAQTDGRLDADMDIDFAFQQIHGLVKGSAFWPQFVGTNPELDEAQQNKLAVETAQMFLARYGITE